VKDSKTSKPILIVTGPTASGKSDFAMTLCAELAGEIVNIDSVQLYKEFTIGSAKPSKADLIATPHHLIDILEPTQKCNASEFSERAFHVIESLQEQDTLPVLVGSSGMYISTLVAGFDTQPSTNEAVRSSLAQVSTADLYCDLLKVDPVRASQLHPTDRNRVARSLEVYRSTGIAHSQFFTGYRVAVRQPAIMLVLLPSRERLYHRINLRSRAMIGNGLIEEVRSLVGKYSDELPLFTSIGYRQTVEFLKRSSVDESFLESDAVAQEALAEEIALHTRRYAKRQMTFWRNEPLKRGWHSFLSLFMSEDEFLRSEYLDLLRETLQGVGNVVQVWYLYTR
jgi:tRNA dimethylallyltransferase